MKWYVDDGMGISPIRSNTESILQDHVADDMAEVARVVRALLGSGAIADDK